MVDWRALEKKVKKLGIEHFVQIGVKSAIEDWILDDIEGICAFLKMKTVPKALKGSDGFSKLADLYVKAHRTYQKGYATKELIATLDMGKIVEKRKDALVQLEGVLGVA